MVWPVSSFAVCTPSHFRLHSIRIPVCRYVVIGGCSACCLSLRQLVRRLFRWLCVSAGMLTALDRVRSSVFAASIRWMFSSGLRLHSCPEVSMLIVDFVFFFVSVIICHINYRNSLSSTLSSIIEYSILLFSTSYSLVLVLRNCFKNFRNLRYVGRHQRPGHHRTGEIL